MYGFHKDIVSALKAEASADDHRGAGGLCRDAAAKIEQLTAAGRVLATIFEDELGMENEQFVSWAATTYTELRAAVAALSCDGEEAT